MFIEREALDAEPPLSSADQLPGSSPEEPECAADIMLAASPPAPDTRAVIIGRRTLEPILALMRSGCHSVTSHSPGAPPTHRDQASLAWVSDLKTSDEMNAAVHQMSHCLGSDGRMVLDATSLLQPTAIGVVLQCLAREGFRLCSVFRRGGHFVLVAARGPAFARAA